MNPKGSYRHVNMPTLRGMYAYPMGYAYTDGGPKGLPIGIPAPLGLVKKKKVRVRAGVHTCAKGDAAFG